MRRSIPTRRGEQSGQMLVSVIVLLTLMFFIGSAMALAVSSSLHTIAQTNSIDSVAYAAESATAQGLAANRQGKAPTVDHQGAGGTTKWSYTYEVVTGAANGPIAGRSAPGQDNSGSAALDATNFETISIPPTPGADHFEVYRTGPDPSTTGYIGDAPGPNPPVINDTGLPVQPVRATCTGGTLAALPSKVNNYALTASTCRVPVGSDPTMWSGPPQFVPGNSCVSQPLLDAAGNGFSTGDEPGTAWGVIGWHDVSSKKHANLYVSIDSSCGKDVDDATPCQTSVTGAGMFYFYCNLKGTPSKQFVYKTLYVVNPGGAANLSAFVVRAADSGSDCVYTTMGKAGLVTDEAEWALPGCGWSTARLSLWNRVLP